MNRFFIVTNSSSFLSYFRVFLSEFLVLRGFHSLNFTFHDFLFAQSFSIQEFTFIKVNDFFFYPVFSSKFLIHYKLKLKMAVKNFGFILSNFDFLKLLNKFIFFWSTNYNYLHCIFDVWSELDIYLYKVLWRWAKRRHPRRPSTWIYSKYWKLFCGSYRFYSLNYNSGSFSILRSHFYKKVSISRLPLSCNFYKDLDQSKISFFVFGRFKNSFTGLFKYFWFKQRGVCFICKKNFTTLNFNNIKICNFGVLTNKISSFSLVHSYCYS